MMGKCFFCGEDKPLCRAHIIGKQFYEGYKTEKYRVLNSFDLRWKQAQNGVWDDGILCADCDNKLGVYDKEGYRVLLDDLESKKRSVNDLPVVYWFEKNDFDFVKLRFFFISLLWRASISSHSMFKDVQLGPYQDIALKILSKIIPDDETLFNVIVSREPEGAPYGKVSYVRRNKSVGKTSYKFIFSKFVVVMIPSLKDASSQASLGKDFFLSRDRFVVVEHGIFYDDKVKLLNKVIKRKEALGR